MRISSEGETWIYNLNMGEAFIPFNFGYRPKIRMVFFDNEGKVTRWSYSKEPGIRALRKLGGPDRHGSATRNDRQQFYRAVRP